MSRLAALRSAGYRRYWFGSMPSVGASQLYFIALGWLIFQLSGSALNLGLMGVAFAVPNILVTIFASFLAARYDRRYIIYFISAANAFLLGVIGVLDAMELVQVWHLLAITALIGILSGVEWPARTAIFPPLVPPEAMPSAVSLFSMLWQGSRMAVPAIGGFMMASWGTHSVFLLGALGFASMCTVVATLPPDPPREQNATTSSWMAGIRFVLVTHPFPTLIVLTYTVTFFGIAYLHIMPAFTSRMGLGEEAFGLLISASGIGSLTGTVLLGIPPKRWHLGLTMCTYVVAGTVPLSLFALVNLYAPDQAWAFPASMALVFFTHMFTSAFIVVGMTALQERVPDELRGRVMGLHGIAFSLINFGAIFFGGVAEVAHPPAALLIGCVILVSASIAAAARLQQLA